MADKSCKNGHLIDESWDLCPYCPQERAETPMAIVRPGSVREVERSSLGGFDAVTRTPAEPLADSRNPRTSVPPMTNRTTAVPKMNFADSVSQRYVVGWLVGLNGKTRGDSFTLRIGRNVIGRDARSDIAVPDDQVSSHHADLVFRLDEKRYILMDHNSTNGTFVNETEIEPRRDLARLDVVRLGTHRFLFVPLEGFNWEDEGRST